MARTARAAGREAPLGNPRSLLPFLAVALAGLAPLGLTAGAAPARAAAGSFFALTVVPALQLLVGAFFGRRPALAVGALVALLTMALVVGPPPAVDMPGSQWRVTLDQPETAAVSVLAAPRASTTQGVLASGGHAELWVCLGRGEPADVRVALEGRELTPADSAAPADCWQRYTVPAAVVPAPRTLEAHVAVRPSSRAELVGGVTRRRPGEDAPGGAALLVGGRRETADLAPGQPGAQTGRYFVELRVFTADGRLAEIWF